MTATSQGNPAPIPVQGTVQLSVADDGVFVIVRLAVYLAPDDAIDACLQMIGAATRIKSSGP